jgi:hypothetical protein
MIFSRAMAYACLMVLAGILAVIAVLLVLLTGVQWGRGEGIPQPMARAVATLISLGLAVGCRALARRLI